MHPVSKPGLSVTIHPDECIDCGICVSVCPPEAIYEDAEVPKHLTHFIAINREFFSPAVTGLGSPAGASSVGAALRDHPVVAASARSPASPSLAGIQSVSVQPARPGQPLAPE